MGVMTKRPSGRIAICVLPLLLPAWPGAAAETPAVPDFTGIWARNVFNFEPPESGPGPIRNLRRVGADAARYITGGDPVPLVGDYTDPILKPGAAETVKRMGEYSASGHDIPDPSNQCGNYSPPYVLAMQQVVRFMPTKNGITLVYSQDDQVRHIRLNGSHPAHPKPSPMGDSVGHYEGETLVVDTVGIAVGPHTVVDRFGTPQSAAMHVVERYRLIDGAAARAAQERQEQTTGRLGGKAGNWQFDPADAKGLQVEVTVEDPNVYTKPWSGRITYRRTAAPWEERICAEAVSEGQDEGIEHPPFAGKPDF
jgi:hypothetical protein